MDELELILTDIFKCSRSDLYLNSNSITFHDREFKALERILKERGKVQPIQYILGHAEFMGLRFNVRKGVLIPRPDTEILVEAVIEEVSQLNRKSRLKILDIGTGSGCIAVALTKHLQNADIIATDVSKDALDLAKENARLNGEEQNVRFLKSNLFKHKFFDSGVKFDIIVSNPPYVPTREIGVYDATLNCEPKIALDGGEDGFDFYRRISKEAKKFLKKGGLLFLELGYGQSDKIGDIFSGWTVEKIIKDYKNIDRVCMIRNN